MQSQMVFGLIKQLITNRNACPGIAAAIRVTTTFNPSASAQEMVDAGMALGLNPHTIRIQFNKARAEDAAMDRWQS